jgi:hypothetical protein
MLISPSAYAKSDTGGSQAASIHNGSTVHQKQQAQYSTSWCKVCVMFDKIGSPKAVALFPAAV